MAQNQPTCQTCSNEIVSATHGRSRRYCSNACRQRSHRSSGHAPRPRPRPQPPLRYVDGKPETYVFRPRNLFLADLALRQGCKLAELILSSDERAVLVASSDRVSTADRLAAARHLARPYLWASVRESSGMPGLPTTRRAIWSWRSSTPSSTSGSRARYGRFEAAACAGDELGGHRLAGAGRDAARLPAVLAADEPRPATRGRTSRHLAARGSWHG